MKWIWPLLVLIAFGGCTLTREVPPSQGYHLEDVNVSPVGKQCDNRVIRVSFIQGAQWLQGTSIHYGGTDGKTYTYLRARWEQPPLEQLQQIVESSIIQSGLFTGVIPYRSLAKNDLLLELHVISMTQTIDERGHGKTELMLYGVLVDQYSRRILSQKTFRYDRTGEGDAQSAVDAWNGDVRIFIPAMIAWLQEACEAHPKLDRSDVDF
jgi:ABC-type uncharacterized transport system auxiliary subunit